MIAKVGVLVALVVVLSLPFAVRLSARQHEVRVDKDGRKLVIVTPHVEQIRDEFGAAFPAWYQKKYGEKVWIDWRVPGGTRDIAKQIVATAKSAAKDGKLQADGTFPPGTSGFDIFFGGGSFEHGQLKRPTSAPGSTAEKKIEYRLSRPWNATQMQLDEAFGENKIGVQTLYDPDRYWIGTALSGFGIVFNREVLQQLGLPDPASFEDLTDARYANMLALADGRQSGSIVTSYDSILNRYGWEKGWRILRDMAANARYFTAAATRVPVDVGQGDAAAGLAIDFYGRGQAQFLLRKGQGPGEGRVGYVDPAGAVYIDADPVSILNGASSPELADRFVEFCLTEEAQAIWCFAPRGAGAAPGQLGPERYQLRRMPVRRVMYEKYVDRMTDKSDPFAAASDVKSQGWRSSIPVLMAAFGIDTAGEVRDAWAVLNKARGGAKAGTISPGVVAEMETAFYAFPTHTLNDGKQVPLDAANYKAIATDTNSWRDAEHGKRSVIAYTEFFREQYRKVVAMGREHGL